MCMYGYCRISQKKQSIERQIRNIKAIYPEAVIIQEAYTGTSIDRKEWNKLYKKAKEGDTIIFDSVSRMSRNAEEGFSAYEELFTRGINLVFLKEPHINTETIGSAPGTSLIPPSSPSSPIIMNFSSRGSSRCPDAAMIPRAIGTS